MFRSHLRDILDVLLSLTFTSIEIIVLFFSLFSILYLKLWKYSEIKLIFALLF